MVDTDNGDGSSAISSVSSRSQGSGSLLEQQRGNLPVTPPRGPLDRVPSEPLMKETEEYASVPESPVSPAATRSVELVRLNDESANDDSRFSDDDNLDQETSQSLLPLSQNMDLASSIAESSQSIIPHSEEPKHKKHDLVEVRTQTRKDGRVIRSVGTVNLQSEQTAKETEEYESTQESLTRNADIRSVDLVRLSGESGNDDHA
eukprot:g14180.t1